MPVRVQGAGGYTATSLAGGVDTVTRSLSRTSAFWRQEVRDERREAVHGRISSVAIGFAGAMTLPCSTSEAAERALPLYYEASSFSMDDDDDVRVVAFVEVEDDSDW